MSSSSKSEPRETKRGKPSWIDWVRAAGMLIKSTRAGGVLYNTVRRAVVVRHKALSRKERARRMAADANYPQSGAGRRRRIDVTDVTLVTQFSKDRCGGFGVLGKAC